MPKPKKLALANRQHNTLLDTAESLLLFGLVRGCFWYWNPKRNVFTVPITGELEEAG